MKTLQSKVKKLAAWKGWDDKMYLAQCIMGGLSHQTARTLYTGSTSVTTDTLVKMAEIFGVSSIADIIDLDEAFVEKIKSRINPLS